MRVPSARPRFALKVVIDAGHDAQQRRFSRAVRAEDADLGAVVEGQPDAAQDLPRRRDDLAQVFHDIDERRRSHVSAGGRVDGWTGGPVTGRLSVRNLAARRTPHRPSSPHRFDASALRPPDRYSLSSHTSATAGVPNERWDSSRDAPKPGGVIDPSGGGQLALRPEHDLSGSRPRAQTVRLRRRAVFRCRVRAPTARPAAAGASRRASTSRRRTSSRRSLRFARRSSSVRAPDRGGR